MPLQCSYTIEDHATKSDTVIILEAGGDNLTQ